MAYDPLIAGNVSLCLENVFMKMKKFLAVVFLFFFGVMIVPNLSRAASLSELRTQIAELSKQVAKLQKAAVVSSLSPTVPNRPAITVVSPNGGESLEIGKSYGMKFSVSGNLKSSSVNIYLVNTITGVKQGLATYDSPVSGEKDVNTFLWTISNDIKYAGGNIYKIGADFYATIKTASRTIKILKATDISDMPFSIVSSSGGGGGGGSTTSPVITVLSPTSGPAGTVVTVMGSNFGSNNTILFNGTIINVPVNINHSSVQFTVPQNTPAGTYGVSVTNTANNYNSNTLVFTVMSSAQPVITVISPNIGFDLIKGRTTQIVWKNGNLQDEIQLINTANLPAIGTTGYTYYEIKSRVNTNAFVSGDANYFNWTVGDIDCPVCATRIGGIPEGKYIIRVIKYSSNGVIGYDDTDMPFSIVSENITPSPSITVISPNGGEKIRFGGQLTINWTTLAIDKYQPVSIIARNYYNYGTGITDYVLADGPLNDGTEIIKLRIGSGDRVPVGVYKIQIKSNVNGAIIEDWSDDYLFILPSDKG